MSRITTYAIKEITSSFLLLLCLLSGVLWMGQGLRHLDLLTSDNVSLISYLSYIILLLPKILIITIPICIFLSILLSLNRLRSDSELIVLSSAGKSEKNILIKPILLISLFLYVFINILSVYITPVSLNEIRQKIIEIRSSGIHSTILKEKKFISPVETLTIFLQERNGNEIDGLLIHDLKNKDKPQTYIAQRGEFIDYDNRKYLRLFNGSVQIFEKNSNKVSEIEFETYDLNLTPYSKEEDEHVYADELFTDKIIDNLKNKELYELNKYEMEQFAELHTRFINPIYIFCFAFLPLIIIKFSKKPSDGLFIPICIISFLAFLIQIFQITMSNLLIDNSNLVIINYFIPLLFILIIILVIFLDNSRLRFYKNA